MIAQVLPQQGCGPDRRVIAEVTRVRVDHQGEPGVDATARGARAARSRIVGQPLPQVDLGALAEPLRPVIDRPAADVEGLGDLLSRLALVEPEQRQGTAPRLGHGGMGGEVFQLQALPGGDNERSHRTTSRAGDSAQRLIVIVQRLLTTYLELNLDTYGPPARLDQVLLKPAHEWQAPPARLSL